MVARVVDASAVAAFLFDEPDADAVFERLLGASLRAPALLQFELANVCLKKCRQTPRERDAIMSAYARRDRFLIREAPVDHDGVVRLAVSAGLTAYDASYLWLARHLGVELVTLDRRLAIAATAGFP